MTTEENVCQSFDDGVWSVIENFYGYDFGVSHILKEYKITKEKAIKLSAKTGFRPDLVSELERNGEFRNV